MPRASWAFLVLPLTIKKLKPVANLERSVHAHFWINFQPQKLWRHFYFWRGGSSLLKQCEYFPTDPCHCPPHLVVSCHSSAICHLALLSFFFFFLNLLASFLYPYYLAPEGFGLMDAVFSQKIYSWEQRRRESILYLNFVIHGMNFKHFCSKLYV